MNTPAVKGQVLIDSESSLVSARRTVRDNAASLGFGITDITRIVTAASELARNVVVYAKSGTMSWQSIETDNSVGLELVFEDHGPGIADLNRAMEEGFSTSKGLGMGLPGTKRLMDEMEI
ncbi:MAG: anti-sigma regulatory factor, partial [bacterium]